MADNTTYTPGTGVTIAADEIASALHQRMKVSIGPDGSAADLSEVRPIPTVPGHPTAKVLTQVRVNESTSGDKTIVSATASQTARVHCLVLTWDGAVTLTFKSGSTTLADLKFTGPGSLTLDFRGEPWFVTAVNEAFIINLSAAVVLKGWMDYEKSA